MHQPSISLSVKSKQKSQFSSGIKGLEEVGSIWIKNEGQRKHSKKLGKLSKRKISDYKNTLARLDRKVDEELITIKRNMK